VGLRFGKLTVIERASAGKVYGARWYCQCNCDINKERLKILYTRQILSGEYGSCGCALKNRETVRSVRMRKHTRNYQNGKYATDPRYNLNVRIGALIRASLQRKGAIKTQSISKSLDFSLDDLEAHLKNTIPPGYVWADFAKGLLQIDHILPVSSFNFDSDIDIGFKQCWALSNLQLLTAEHNLEKRNKLNWVKPYEDRKNSYVFSCD